jgi:hypothetical protein
MITMTYKKNRPARHDFRRGWCVALLATLSILWGGEARANALGDETLKMQTSTMTRQTMPDSCDSPYKDVSGFEIFFDSALFVIASERGAQEKGVADLFAVSELQKKMKDLFPNLGEDRPIDRLIIAQLCQYREIFKKNNRSVSDVGIVINSDDPILQKHLLSVASRLFIDARELMVSALAAHARSMARRNQINLTVERVEQARQLGRNKIEGLFRSFQ